MGAVKAITFLRHAAREKDADALSPEGRVQAEDVGRTLRTDFAMIFVSPAHRTAETVAWLLRGSGQKLPSHSVTPALATQEEDRWRAAAKAAGSSRVDAIRAVDPDLVTGEVERLGRGAEELFDRVPDGGRALAVGHSPLIEAAVFGLTGVVLEPLAECQGLTITRNNEGKYEIGEP